MLSGSRSEPRLSVRSSGIASWFRDSGLRLLETGLRIRDSDYSRMVSGFGVRFIVPGR